MFLLEVFFIMLLPFCLIQVSTKNNEGFLKFVFVLVVLSLFLMAGFRVSSPDYSNYETYYQLLANGADYRDINIVAADPFFAYLNYTFAWFSNDPLTIFLFFSLASVAINLSCYKSYSPYFFICIVFYISHTYVAREMMQIRAGLACALCLFSLRFILQRRLYAFCFTVLLASATHLGACIFLIAYFLGNINVKRKVLLISLVLAFIIALFYPFGNLFKQLPAIDFLQRAQYYSNSKYGEQAGVLNNLIIIKGILIIFFCLYYHESLKKLNKYYLLAFNLYFFSVIWYLVWNDFEIFAARIATFFSITEVLLLSYIPLLLKTVKNKIIGTSFLLFFSLMILTLNVLTGKWDDVVLPWVP